VRDIIPAPHDVEDTAGAAVLDGVCVIIADDARTASLIVSGDYSSDHAPPLCRTSRRHTDCPFGACHAGPEPHRTTRQPAVESSTEPAFCVQAHERICADLARLAALIW
jgi:hypothetical protein